MPVDWGDYEPFDLGPLFAPGALSLVEARAAFERCVRSRSSRIEALTALASRNGVTLTSSEASLQELNDWYCENVEADPDREPGYLRPEWYSVTYDVAMFLGERLVACHPGLRWELYIGSHPRDYYRHQPVVVGFAGDRRRHRNVFPPLERMLGYGHQVIAAKGSIRAQGVVRVHGIDIDLDELLADRERTYEPGQFLRWFAIAQRWSDGTRDPATEEAMARLLGPWGRIARWWRG